MTSYSNDKEIEEMKISRSSSVDQENDEDHIKSKAIVKFSAVQVPATFARLQCNTNLNMPPSNWLSNSVNSYGLQHAMYNSTGFASFQMAHMFPDCVGDVDVVSAAENIKNLLKLPYSPNSAISLMVHRIENTLLIDDFDIHKYLLRKSDDDWNWLRSFLLENILNSLSEKDLSFFIRNKSRDALQQKRLISKFLYYSLKGNENDQEKASTSSPTKSQESMEHLQKFELIKKPIKSGPILPEPSAHENLPEPNKSHVYNRNVVWTFEDIRMLIGTDMPIFGGGKRPCISLRLRDMSKPINVLTGIDYWLDNLMCNVPEVVMCYHLDGIVQKYELIKTEDLPQLENSQFSPKIIRNVAQNILSFLKANATKAGHTYWLFKGSNDDVVKLYDLTTLCGDTTINHDNTNSSENHGSNDKEDNGKSENPFTIPVAMLLYTVARNMKNSYEKLTPKQAGSIKALLDNCIQLLPKEKYPQIVTSSYYLLSDLHIPAGIDPGSPDFNTDDNDDIDSIYDEPQCEYENPNDNENIAVKIIQETMEEYNLEENWKHNSVPPALTGTTEERCEMALKNIAKGLNCLQYFQSNEEKLEKEEERKKIRHEEEHPKMAKPYQPIPLPYEPLKPEPDRANLDVPIPLGWKEQSMKLQNKRNKKVKKDKTEQESLPQAVLLRGERSWNEHLKILLLEKTCLTYATLAESSYSSENYGKSLRYIYMALRCQQIVTNYISTIASQKSCLLGRAGDCFFQLAKNWNEIKVHLLEFKIESAIDKQISEELFKDIGKEIEHQLPIPIDNIEQLMRTSCGCYEAAIESATDVSRLEILRRLGSVRNELGVKYMHWAQEEYTRAMEKQNTEEKVEENDTLSEVLYQTLACKSYDCFNKGIAIFEEVKDVTNLAFLLCNMGRFMRFRAHIHLPGETKNCLGLQKKFYSESFIYYNRALGILGNRKCNVELWDLVNWELSTATFTLAKQMQDCSEKNDHLDVEEIETEVIEMLMKSLKICDTETQGPRQILYLFRAAMIHHRLASFYHQSYRTQTQPDEQRKKTVLQIARLHYEKASKILENLQEPKEFFQVQLERIGLQEFQAEQSTSSTIKFRHLQSSLEIILKSQGMIKLLKNLKSEENRIEIRNYLDLFEQRLQAILKSLTKLCLTKKVENSEKFVELYKKMYSLTLKVKIFNDFNEFVEHLDSILANIQKIKT